MIKRLTRHGNSLALVIDKPILELLNIEADTPLEISTDGQKLTIMPVAEPERERKVRDAVTRVHEQYGDVLKRLAE